MGNHAEPEHATTPQAKVDDTAGTTGRGKNHQGPSPQALDKLLGHHADASPTSDARKGSHEVDVHPNKFDHDLVLGEKRTTNFALPSRKQRLMWSHQFEEDSRLHELKSRDMQEAPLAYTDFVAKTPGKRTLVTKVFDGEHQLLANPVKVTYRTPKPDVKIERLDSISARGILPVIGRAQIGEEIRVTARLDDVHRALPNVVAYNGDPRLPVTRITPIGDGRYYVFLKPQQLGSLSVNLYLMPEHVSSKQINSSGASELEILPMQDEHDYGGRGAERWGRESDTHNAVHVHLRQAIQGLFNRRKDAVDDFERLVRAGAEPQDSTLPTLILSLAGIALSAGAAGIATVAASKFAAKYLTKITSEVNLNAATEIVKVGVENSITGGAAAVAQLGDNNENLLAAFTSSQTKTLTNELDPTMVNTLTNVASRAKALDAAEAQLGMRHVMAITATLRDMHEEANRIQLEKTLESWCTLLAKARLQQKRVNHDPLPPTKKGGIDMSRVARIPTPENACYNGGPCETENRSPIPGTILMRVGTDLKIKSARAVGIDSAELRVLLVGKPLLKVPVPVVIEHDQTTMGAPQEFRIAKNEKNEVWANSRPPTLAAFHGTTPFLEKLGDGDVKMGAIEVLRRLGTVPELSS